MRYCRDVAIELGVAVPDGPFLPAECCNSCHDDYAEGWADLIWIDDETQVCCAWLRSE